jgi:acyl transferase domain-containing protein
MPVRITGLWLDAWDRGCRWVLVGPVEAGSSDAGDERRAVRFLGDDGRCFGEIVGIDLVPLELRAALVDSAPETWVHGVEWRPLPGPGEAKSDRPAEGRWLVLSDRRGVGAALARAIEGAGGQPLVAYAADSPGAEVQAWQARPDERADLSRLLTMSLEAPGPPLKAIIHLWSLDSEAEEGGHLARAQRLGCESLLAALQELAGRPLGPAPRLWAVTRGAQAVAGREAVAVSSAPVWGLGRVAAEEFPDCWGGLIDIDPAASAEEDARQILGEITREGEDAVAFRRGRRYAPRLAPAGSSLAPRAFDLRPGGAYLVTGGFGSLGLEIARWLASRGARHLILMGRTALPPRERWDEALAERQTRAVAGVRGLEGAGVTVRLVSADVADEAAVAALLEQLSAEGGRP